MPEDITVVGAAKALRARRQEQVTAENKAERRSAEVKVSVPKAPTVSASDAIKNERVGSEGERSFGAPVQGSAFDNQNTDKNN